MNYDRNNHLSDDEISEVAGGASKDYVEMNGTVIELLPNAVFRVQLENGEVVRAQLSGKMRMNFVRLIVGDQVTVEVKPDSDSLGRVTYRFKRP